MKRDALGLKIIKMGQSLAHIKNKPSRPTRASHSDSKFCKTFIVCTGTGEIRIEVTDRTLTCGWLISETVRKYTGKSQVLALSTVKSLEILDMWLGLFDRELTPFNNNEKFLLVFEQPVPSEISNFHFEPMKLIGKGGFSKVILARKKDSSRLFAIKRINKDFIVQENKVQQMLVEKQILEKVHHPFVINLHWAYQTANDLNLVMDFCPGGELFFHLQHLGRFTEEHAQFYFCEILLGLEYIHSLNIIYRDLKPENILLDIDGHVCIIDFGLSKFLENSRERSFSFCGSPEYMSPEMLQKQGHGRTVDFYSLGALLFEMLTGLPPYYHPNRKEMYSRILNEPISFPNYIGKMARNLMRGLLQKQPTHRLGSFEGAVEVKKHPWLADVNWEEYYHKQVIPPYRPNLRVSNFDPEYTSEPVDHTEFSVENCKFGPDDPFYEFDYTLCQDEAIEESANNKDGNKSNYQAHRENYKPGKKISLDFSSLANSKKRHSVRPIQLLPRDEYSMNYYPDEATSKTLKSKGGHRDCKLPRGPQKVKTDICK